ncbi:MAG: hypothetical protein IJS63_11830 [Bacteroidaceae bacterium]|nr:hypothetical protein [Bacteroidaceae bacterium]
MKKKYRITEEDYQKLFNGSVKYLISFYHKVGYGYRPLWLDVVLYNLRSRYGKMEYKYRHYLQFYSIYVHSPLPAEKLLWTEDAMKEFIEEKGLKPGDVLQVWYIKPHDYGREGFWSAGATDYVILEHGWEKIREIRGA